MTRSASVAPTVAENATTAVPKILPKRKPERIVSGVANGSESATAMM